MLTVHTQNAHVQQLLRSFSATTCRPSPPPSLRCAHPSPPPCLPRLIRPQRGGARSSPGPWPLPHAHWQRTQACQSQPHQPCATWGHFGGATEGVGGLGMHGVVYKLTVHCTVILGGQSQVMVALAAGRLGPTHQQGQHIVSKPSKGVQRITTARRTPRRAEHQPM